jgi:uncharacterized RDD family membrane protein YckC
MTNPYAPPSALVQDVIDTGLHVTLADRGTRLGAVIIDTIAMALMVYAPMFAGMPFAAGSDTAGTVVLVGFTLGLVGFVWWAWLTIKYIKTNGQSIGKKMLNIKVVRRDGSPASLGRIFWMRNVVNGLISIIPGYSVVEVLFIFGEKRECLHDKLADTMVIRA